MGGSSARRTIPSRMGIAFVIAIMGRYIEVGDKEVKVELRSDEPDKRLEDE